MPKHKKIKRLNGLLQNLLGNKFNEKSIIQFLYQLKPRKLDLFFEQAQKNKERYKKIPFLLSFFLSSPFIMFISLIIILCGKNWPIGIASIMFFSSLLLLSGIIVKDSNKKNKALLKAYLKWKTK